MTLFLAAGCSTLRTRTYTVEIVNKTNSPLAVGLVKDGPPLEKGWDSPEQIAVVVPELMDKRWGRLVAPDGQAVIGPIDGKFGPETRAFLRVYEGDKTIEELVSYSPNDPRRVHILLLPGTNVITITKDKGWLDATVQQK